MTTEPLLHLRNHCLQATGKPMVALPWPTLILDPISEHICPETSLSPLPWAEGCGRGSFSQEGIYSIARQASKQETCMALFTHHKMSQSFSQDE